MRERAFLAPFSAAAVALLASCSVEPVALTPVLPRVHVVVDDGEPQVDPLQLGEVVQAAPHWWERLGFSADRLRVRRGETLLGEVEKGAVDRVPLPHEVVYVHAVGARVHAAPDERAVTVAKLTVGSTVAVYNQTAPLGAYRLLVAANGRGRGYVSTDLVGLQRPSAELFKQDALVALLAMDLDRARTRLERAAMLDRDDGELPAMLASVYRIQGLPEWRNARTVARKMGYTTPAVPEEASTSTDQAAWMKLRDRARETHDWDLFADAELARVELARSEGGRITVRGELFYACRGDPRTAEADSAVSPNELEILSAKKNICVLAASLPERPPEKSCSCGCGLELYRESARNYEAPDSLSGPELEKFLDESAQRSMTAEAEYQQKLAAELEEQKTVAAEWSAAAAKYFPDATPYVRVTITNAGTAPAKLRARQLTVWKQTLARADFDPPWTAELDASAAPVFERGGVEKLAESALPEVLGVREQSMIVAKLEGQDGKLTAHGVWALGLDLQAQVAAEILDACAKAQPWTAARACFLRAQAERWIPLHVSVPELCACQCGW